MDPKRHRLVQRRGWDQAAYCYERYWSRQLRPAQDRLMTQAGLQPGEHVLDIACGTGLVTIAAADAVGSCGSITATDLSPRMVAEAATRAENAGRPLAQAVACGAEDLAVDGPFDVALCALGLMYVPDKGRALAEMIRVLKPGGRAVVSVWGRRGDCGWAELFGIVERRVSSDVCPLFFDLGIPGVLNRQLETAGFVDVDQVRLAVTLDYEDDDEALGAAFLGGPVALAYARFDAATRGSAHREYLDSIRPYRTAAGGYRVPGEFVIARGRRP